MPRQHVNSLQSLDERADAALRHSAWSTRQIVEHAACCLPEDPQLAPGIRRRTAAERPCVVGLAVDLFLDGVPAELLAEKLNELGIDRMAFDQDMARVRRLTPGPVRKTLRRVPGMVAQAGGAIENSGVGPRVRNWISKEESIA